MSVQDLMLVEKVGDGSKSKGLFLESVTRLLEQSIIVGEPRQIIPINLVRLQTDRLGTKAGDDNPYARVYRDFEKSIRAKERRRFATFGRYSRRTASSRPSRTSRCNFEKMVERPRFSVPAAMTVRVGEDRWSAGA